MPAPKETHYVYADGSCLGNPGPGGWAAVIVKPSGVSRTIYGGDPATTNNRMELTAAIEGLRVVPTGTRVVLRSDSQYVVKTMTLGWKRKQNVDLWEKLDHEAGERRVIFEWVEGHAGDPLNEEADRNARHGATIAAKSGRIHYHGLSIVSDEPKPSPANEFGTDGEVVRELRPLLTGDETVRRCVGCGRAFVGPAGDAPPYCALAACQLKARRPADMSGGRRKSHD
ncbi:MAG TPA: ribonuclease H [Candidatus Binataceae bacterium]|nr:ribonuclease H [Candidatus Binataceae bacterium]